MALGMVNNLGPTGDDLSYIKSTADLAMAKANSNKVDIDKVKQTADNALEIATNHNHNYAGSSSPGGPATTALSCTGNAETSTKATYDSAGQNINKTYIKKLSVFGLDITCIKGDNTQETVSLDEGVLSRISCMSRFSDHFRMI